MLCPQEYLDKKIEIKTSVKNHEFFSSNFVNNWTFRNYLVWTGDIFLRRIKSYYRDYQNSLISLSKKQKMDRDLCEYVADLMKKKGKFSDLELKQLREELNEKPDDTAERCVNITNSVVTDSNIILAQRNSTVSFRQSKRRRESLPSTGK
ncbi:hypothetical protein K501DRAFT_189736 [Backusella circina FSU 941]|nr:hypothetical protein K501DRAFT_189736 [Backusella circina FSU 941]